MSVTTPLLPPTLADIKSWSRMDFRDLDEPFNDQDLQVRIERACAYLNAVTGRPIDDTMPLPLVPIAQEAVQLRVEQIVVQEQQDYTETVNDDSVMSFSAGGYSETRHTSMTRSAPAVGGSLPLINVAPWLNKDIWLLCTDDMRTYWTETLLGASAAATIPSFEVTEADWGNYGGLYPYGFGPGAFRGPLIDASIWGA
jgi:hypothetical protein